MNREKFLKYGTAVFFTLHVIFVVARQSTPISFAVMILFIGFFATYLISEGRKLLRSRSSGERG